MLRRLSLIIVVLLGAVLPAPARVLSAEDKLKVVTTLPDLAILTREIGGDRVEVKALARPGQNLHGVRVKPSFLVAVSRADLFIQVGLSLEHAWVPGLLETARNRHVLPGNEGFINAGVDYATIEVPVRLDRALSADVHPQGNPHINLSLGGGRHMASRILAGLTAADPGHADEYQARHAAWLARYERARERWDLVAKTVAAKGEAACLYHQEFDYLLNEMGLEIAAFLEPRPGLAPTPKHLARVIRTIREQRIPVILTAPWSNNKNVARVSKTTGAPVLELPVMAGGKEPRHGTWIGMIDDCVDRIALAYGVDPKTIDVPRRAVGDKLPESDGAASRDR